MKKNELKNKTASVKNETTAALQMVLDATNKGQRNKLLKNEKVSKLLTHYGVKTDG